MKFASTNHVQLHLYPEEMEELAKDCIADINLILNFGAGELTTVSALSQHLPKSNILLAAHISLIRLQLGPLFTERVTRHEFAATLDLFLADMGRVPLAGNSVDMVFTSYALDSNQGRDAKLLRKLLREVSRVVRLHLIFFEPSWEHATTTELEMMVR